MSWAPECGRDPGRLIYSAISSLDGYIEDADGRFDWGVPDEDAHAFINDLERPVGTYLQRAPDVRGDVRLGDRPHARRAVTRNARLREDLARG